MYPSHFKIDKFGFQTILFLFGLLAVAFGEIFNETIIGLPGSASAQSSNGIKVDEFGITSDTKESVKVYTLTNSVSSQIELIEFGASLRRFKVALKNGSTVDVVLGYETFSGYESNNAYLGCIVGRVCNRIKNAEFTINNKAYHLPKNVDNNSLHGGIKGFSRRLWKTKDFGFDYVVFEYLSKDGEEGYPSTVRATVTYRLAPNASVLSIEFDAVNEGNETTPVSMTTHSYFNLGGVDQSNLTIENHQLTVLSDFYLPSDNEDIVTGEIRSVKGSVFDLRSPSLLKEKLKEMRPSRGFNNHFCKNVTSSPKLMAVLSFPENGLTMSLSGTQPGVHVYVAQDMHESDAKYGRFYGPYSGIALEPQHYPNAVNQPNFPSVWLNPGEKYHQIVIYEIKQQ